MTQVILYNNQHTRMNAVHATDGETNALPRLKLKVKDFGPIESADISLKKLTILMGPNNCGKSHIAKLIHSVISCESKLGTPRFLPFNPPHEIMQKILDMAKRVDDGQEAHSDVAEDLMRSYMSHFFPQVLLGSIPAESREEIIRSGSGAFLVEIHSGIANTKIRGTPKSLNVDTTAPGICVSPSLELPYSSDDTIKFDEARNELKLNILPHHASYSKRPEMMLGDMGRLFEYHALLNTFRTSHYMPGERAGLLETYHSAIDGMLDTASSHDNAKSSTISEFMEQLLFLSDKRGIFASLVDDMELAMTGGRIDVSRHQMGHVSDIKYVHNGCKIPIDATSSSIKSVTPLFLQLKHRITNRDLLILEEPEVGLDLDNQTRLAAFIARLVRLGLCLVVTTHSVHFIDKMSNCLRSGMLRTDGHEHSVISKDESISQDEVVVYQFDRPDDTGGFKTVPAELTAYSGINASLFAKTDDKLYEELLALDMQADGGMSDE